MLAERPENVPAERLFTLAAADMLCPAAPTLPLVLARRGYSPEELGWGVDNVRVCVFLGNY